MQSGLQVFILARTPVKFVPSRSGKYALSQSFRNVETHAKKRVGLFLSQVLFLLQVEICLKEPKGLESR